MPIAKRRKLGQVFEYGAYSKNHQSSCPNKLQYVAGVDLGSQVAGAVVVGAMQSTPLFVGVHCAAHVRTAIRTFQCARGLVSPAQSHRLYTKRCHATRPDVRTLCALAKDEGQVHSRYAESKSSKDSSRSNRFRLNDTEEFGVQNAPSNHSYVPFSDERRRDGGGERRSGHRNEEREWRSEGREPRGDGRIWRDGGDRGHEGKRWRGDDRRQNRDRSSDARGWRGGERDRRSGERGGRETREWRGSDERRAEGRNGERGWRGDREQRGSDERRNGERGWRGSRETRDSDERRGGRGDRDTRDRRGSDQRRNGERGWRGNRETRGSDERRGGERNGERGWRGNRETREWRDQRRDSGPENYKMRERASPSAEEMSEIQLALASGDDLLYGLQSVWQALSVGRRTFHRLYIQEGSMGGGAKAGPARKATNVELLGQVAALAREKEVHITNMDKGDLNALCANRPHQGVVLRCDALSYERCAGLGAGKPGDVVLALDEVRDPQNVGALIRSAAFLGARNVVVCAKNSAPLTPTLSRASAGAVEIATPLSVDSMPRFLRQVKEEGWRILGAAAAVDAVELRVVERGQPTVLVLGSEGDGLRTMVRQCCDRLVRISRADSCEMHIDSLNVSVAGALGLYHLL